MWDRQEMELRASHKVGIFKDLHLHCKSILEKIIPLVQGNNKQACLFGPGIWVGEI